MAVAVGTSTTPKAEKDRAQTPPWFMRSLESHLGKTFDIDVCCSSDTAKAQTYYSLDEGDDCLKQCWVSDWNEYSQSGSKPNGYCNPPFSNILPFISKVIEQVGKGALVVMLLPNNPETQYVRRAKSAATTIIEMPFRLKFLRPDGTPFLDKHGKPQTPKFSCLIAVFTKSGLDAGANYYYHDFRVGFKP